MKKQDIEPGNGGPIVKELNKGKRRQGVSRKNQLSCRKENQEKKEGGDGEKDQALERVVRPQRGALGEGGGQHSGGGESTQKALLV